MNNYIICNKFVYKDYYIYLCINSNDYLCSIAKNKLFDIGFILLDDMISYQQHPLHANIFIQTIMHLISHNFIINYHYPNIFKLLYYFLSHEIQPKSFIDILLSIISYIGYGIEYTHCSICNNINPYYFSTDDWKAKCDKHKNIHDISNFFLIEDNKQMFILINQLLHSKSINIINKDLLLKIL